MRLLHWSLITELFLQISVSWCWFPLHKIVRADIWTWVDVLKVAFSTVDPGSLLWKVVDTCCVVPLNTDSLTPSSQHFCSREISSSSLYLSMSYYSYCMFIIAVGLIWISEAGVTPEAISGSVQCNLEPKKSKLLYLAATGFSYWRLKMFMSHF